MIAGAFDAWLVHRSIATLDLRLTRASATALAIHQFLAEQGVPSFHPSTSPVAAQMRLHGPVVSFDLGSQARAEAFLRGAAPLVTDATSFGGVHSSAERRLRWKMDAVGPGFIRFSAGIEDVFDVLEAVRSGLVQSSSASG